MGLRDLKVGDLVTHVYKGVNNEYSLGVVLATETSIGLVKVKWSSGNESLHVHYMLKWVA
jgi:hypothetical protein